MSVIAFVHAISDRYRQCSLDRCSLNITFLAPSIDPKQFTSMMRLDHDRSLAQVANKYKTNINEVKKVIVWGNHSNTQVPDLSYAEVSGKNIKEIINDPWYTNHFIPRIQKRGAEIIEARGLSSAASAANAAVTHMRDWIQGSNEWLSIGQISNGNSYGISENLMFSFLFKWSLRKNSRCKHI